jgi:anti-anti-sigma regulatory factor
MHRALSIRVLRLNRSTYVLTAHGPVDAGGAGKLAEELRRLPAERLIVDLLDVPALDPSAIDVLRGAEERAHLTVVAEPRLLRFAPFRVRYALSDAVAEVLA